MLASIDVIPFLSVLAGALTALMSAVVTTLGKRAGNRKISESAKEERDYKSEVRLTHVAAMLTREIERRQFFSVASALLILSQFIVGGVLASSFVMKSLGEFVVGVLGLIVLLSSLVNQHFRPDLLRRASSEKLRRLRSLKRKLEDELYVLTRRGMADEELIRLRLFATESLERIEDEEMELLNNEKDERA